MAGQKMNGKKKGTIVGAIGFGAVFALICAVFHPSGFGGIFASLLASGLAGTVLGIMGSGLDTSKNQKSGNSTVSTVTKETGNPELDALLQKAGETIAEIRRENDLIPDSELSEKLSVLEAKCTEIFHIVEQKPEKASQIRKFMAYYLPTTLKMVKGYRTMDSRDDSEEARKAKQDIVEAVDLVNRSCDTLVQKLYRNDLLDLTTEIDVLQQMLKRDGLTESDLEQAAAQARAAAALDTLVNQRRKETAESIPAEQPKAEEKAETADETVTVQASHIPQCPTLSGGVYTLPGGQQAMATAMQKEK